ncbi:SIR2 family protein [Sunxiuqinia indica]|uniref:SIR2 family protein n=1 Tax=Sunxiuqinia indica TaxID=2692584 RepID=UPI0019159126|nr:SIR2 family protein [Sunxiuqinia indica]
MSVVAGKIFKVMSEGKDIYFYKGTDNVLEKSDKSDLPPIERIQKSFEKVLDGKNLSFLLGSGCSSYYEGEMEVGVSTMKPLAKKFYDDILSEEERDKLKTTLGIDVSLSKFKENLEYFLGSLHSIQFFEESIQAEQIQETTHEADEPKQEEQEESDPKDRLSLIIKTVKKVKEFLIDEMLNEPNKKDGKDEPVNKLYERFYRKLLYRNSNLPKPNIFTTNYDLYSETALDKLGIHYVNGFSGGIKKYFNPTIFNYALAERMDLSQNKWGVIDNFFYLYKIHGSINWIQDVEGAKLFNVREIQETTAAVLKSMETVMIHPTPLKHNASLGSPYSDLFREFQKKLMQNNNVLVTIGYSFSDEHINNLIYQAFTIPSFRLIVLGSPATGTEIEKLRSLNDPRIWIIGGELEDEKKLHYFEGFVDAILPDLTNDEIDDKIENAIRTLFKRNEQGR